MLPVQEPVMSEEYRDAQASLAADLHNRVLEIVKTEYQQMNIGCVISALLTLAGEIVPQPGMDDAKVRQVSQVFAGFFVGTVLKQMEKQKQKG